MSKTNPFAGSRPNFFLSYSHKDMDLVLELNDCLERHGFDVRRDRDDLIPGEKFGPRLEALISESETMVIVLSRHWLASEHCRQELAIAEQIGRRIIPVIIEPIDPSEMPANVATRHFVFVYGDGQAFARGIADLINTLMTDISWVREQTRLQARAEDWDKANQSPALLLRGEALEMARKWLSQPAPDQVQVLPQVVEFISAAERQEVTDQKNRNRTRNRIWGASALAVISILGVFALYFRGEALSNEKERAQAVAQASEERALASEARANELEARMASFASASDDVEAAEGDTIQVTADPAITESVGIASPRSLRPESRADRLVAAMNSTDKPTRLSSGEQVATAVRAENNRDILEALVTAIEPPVVKGLSPTGRFNTLYMLNVQPNWNGSPWASRIDAALTRMETETFIGNQTRHCIDTLRAKLANQKGVANVCGNIVNYFDKGETAN